MATEYTDPEPLPKYWDTVIRWGVVRSTRIRIQSCIFTPRSRPQPFCDDPIPLESLRGTYRWVFVLDNESGQTEYRYESDPKVIRKLKKGREDHPGHITITFPEGEEPSLENLTVSFRLVEGKGSFTGVTKRQKNVVSKSDEENDDNIQPNFWTIPKITWDLKFSLASEYAAEAEEMEYRENDHTLDVSGTLDDNGNRYVTFIWGGEERMHCIAKKQVDDKTLVGLTDAERDRMGMYLDDAEVKRRATTLPNDVELDTQQTTGNKRKPDIDDEERNVKRKREDTEKM